jgi:DNA-binding GntR family transcriptional regulator
MQKRNRPAVALVERVETRLPQVESIRLYRQIASLLSDKIADGVFPIGTLLPAERDLARR